MPCFLVFFFWSSQSELTPPSLVVLLLFGFCRDSSVPETEGVFHTLLVKASHNTRRTSAKLWHVLFIVVFCYACPWYVVIGDRDRVTVACLPLSCYATSLRCHAILVYATVIPCLALLHSYSYHAILDYSIAMPCLAMLLSCHAMLCLPCCIHVSPMLLPCSMLIFMPLRVHILVTLVRSWLLWINLCICYVHIVHTMPC